MSDEKAVLVVPVARSASTIVSSSPRMPSRSFLSPLHLSRDMWLPLLFIHASSFSLSLSLAPISIRISRHRRLLQHLWMAVRKWMERPAKRPAGRLSFDPDDRKIERDRLAVSQKRTSRALHRKRERRAEEERDSREGLKSERSF